ncbi:MAG: flippase-like domain-containing protein [Rhodobacteraceae bacterium]|nr:flippase-like domain-containing protein [Paracoccaceae bacterium]
MIGRRAARAALGLAVSGGFVWLILRAVPMPDLAAALGSARPAWIAAACGCFALGYSCRILRWRQMLRAEGAQVSFGRAAVPFMASVAANNVLPFRAGDVLRAFGFSAWLGARSSGVVATLLVERLLDMLALLLALGLALLWLDLGGTDAQRLLGLGSGALIALAAVIVAMLVAPRLFEAPVTRAIVRLTAGRGDLAARASAAMANLFRVMRAVTGGARALALLGWSALAWAAEAGVFYCVARSLPAMTVPDAAWLAMPVGTLSTLLPSTPGYIGTFHYFVIQAAQIPGNPAAAAAGFAVLSHLVLWLSATAVGGVCFGIFVLWRARPDARREVTE